MEQDEFTLLRTFIGNILSVTDNEWKLHRDHLNFRRVKKGEFLLKEGQVCDHVYFVNKGSFRIYALVRGQEVTNYFFFENLYVTDYASFLTRTPSSDNIVALEDSEVLSLSYTDVQKLYEMPVWQKYGRLMAEHVYLLAVERAKSLQHYSPEELYLKIMQEQPQIIERVPQQYIASYMAIQPESLSRIRKRLMTEEKKV